MKSVTKRISYILKAPIRGKGIIGDVVNLAPGYGRFLENKHIAIRATKKEIEQIEENKKQWQEQQREQEIDAKKILEKLEKIGKIQIIKRVAQGDRLYETIKTQEILLEIEKLGLKLKKEYFKIDNIIKKLGVFEIIINPYGNLETKFIVEVVAEEK